MRAGITQLEHGSDGGDGVALQPVVDEHERPALRPRRLPLRDQRPASSPPCAAAYSPSARRLQVDPAALAGRFPLRATKRA